MLWVGGQIELHRRAGSLRRDVFCCLLTLFLLLSGCPRLYADQLEDLAEKAGIRIESKGNSSAAVRRNAAQLVPLNRMTVPNRARAETIIESCSQFRRLPQLRYTVDRAMYTYLLQHPDVAVSTWRAMGISEFQMLQTGEESFQASATDGSAGTADILYQDDQEIVFVCTGLYNNILLPGPLTASALIRFRYTLQPYQHGTHLVTQQADVFVHFPSAGIAGLAKLLSPVTNGLMDRNLFEVSLYAAMMSRAVRQDPEWIISMAWDLDGVRPERRGELAKVAGLDRFAEDSRTVRIRPAGDTRYNPVTGEPGVSETLNQQRSVEVPADNSGGIDRTISLRGRPLTEVVADYPEDGPDSR